MKAKKEVKGKKKAVEVEEPPVKKGKGREGKAVPVKDEKGAKAAAKAAKQIKSEDGKKRKREEVAMEEEPKKVVAGTENRPLSEFEIREETKAKLITSGIKELFPIQAATFEHVMDGKDLIARARTGTGKTLSFVLPMIEKMLDLKESGEGPDFSKRGRAPTAIILSPTRELAKQISKVVESLCDKNFSCLCVYGGTPYAEQEMPLMRGVDVVVGTPGRCIDFLDRGKLKLSSVRFFVLDEADEMLNIGFKDAVDRMFQAVTGKTDEQKTTDSDRPLQTLLFSATVPEWVSSMTKTYFRKDYVTVDLVGSDTMAQTATRIEHLRLPCPWSSRAKIIGDIVLVYAGAHGKTIIFTETKKEANELALDDCIKQDCAVLHGDIAQAQRETTFQAFRDGKFKCLVATDVAARGLDIPEVDLVVMCHPTKDPDTYVHRAGRTGRAGRSGTAVTLFTPRELPLLRQIERRIKQTLKQLSCPQPADIVKANARDIKLSVEEVHEEVLPLFEDTAQKMIEEMGPVKALCASLAVIAGQTTPLQSRSMLSSLDGFRTFLLRSTEPMSETRMVFQILRRSLPQMAVSSIKGIRLIQGNPAMGAAFDVPEERVKEFLSAPCPAGAESLEQVLDNAALPPLQDPPNLNQGGGFGGQQRGGWGNQGVGRSSFGSYASGPRSNNGSPGSARFGSPRTPGGGGGRPLSDTDDRKVFVGGLSFSTNEAEVNKMFSDVAPVERVTMLMDQETKTFKGVGFVTMQSKDGADKVLALNGKKVQGRALRVNMANAKPAKNI